MRQAGVQAAAMSAYSLDSDDDWGAAQPSETDCSEQYACDAPEERGGGARTGSSPTRLTGPPAKHNLSDCAWSQ